MLLGQFGPVATAQLHERVTDSPLPVDTPCAAPFTAIGDESTVSAHAKIGCMCGIVGYVGTDKSLEVLLGGLKRLEYRGYDSAGIAVIGPDGRLGTAKKAGKLSVLSDDLGANPIPNGGTGIGHTRWATHGGPTDRNAHPHLGDDGPPGRHPQRHHRELRDAEGRAARRRLRLRVARPTPRSPPCCSAASTGATGDLH